MEFFSLSFIRLKVGSFDTLSLVAPELYSVLKLLDRIKNLMIDV